MISIDRLEEMAIEELQIKLKNFEEQIKLQNNFIDSLFKATNNSEWLGKSMLDDEVSEVIEKIELDYEQLDQLKTELKSAKELREYTYDCCKQAGEELAKNSFEWDGKEKNLVVQAMELNERYDQLKAENDELRQLLSKEPLALQALQSGYSDYKKRSEVFFKMVQEYKQTLTEIKEVTEKSYRTPLAEKDCIVCDDFLRQILQKISEVLDVASD